jgi:hypothetical protein
MEKEGLVAKRERKIGGKKGISGKREENCSRKREGELVEKGGLVEKGRWRLSWTSPQTYPCALHGVLEFEYLGAKGIK